MKSIIGVFILAFFCTGCVAHMVEKRGEHIQVFGKKQARGGVVRYLNTGMDAWKQARRKDAEKQMQKYCSGPYTILAEGPRSQFGADMPIGKSVSLEMDEYTYVSFECEKK